MFDANPVFDANQGDTNARYYGFSKRASQHVNKAVKIKLANSLAALGSQPSSGMPVTDDEDDDNMPPPSYVPAPRFNDDADAENVQVRARTNSTSTLSRRDSVVSLV